MIIDIDDSKSVLQTVHNLAEGWFIADDLYFQIKGNGKIKDDFWNSSSPMLDTIANFLFMANDTFRERWNKKCSKMDLKIMAYHCTRNNDRDVFLKKGILPLSNDIINDFFSGINTVLQIPLLTPKEIAELTRSVVGDDKWKYRLAKPGPYFLLSYKEATIPDNDYHQNGPEIWWLFVDHFIMYCHEKKIRIPCSDRASLRCMISKALTPFIIHCKIPYSMIPSKDYCTFNILKTFFTSIDPDYDSGDAPEEISNKAIDLNGQTLEPIYFNRIETL
jgi:hypothetical protein